MFETIVFQTAKSTPDKDEIRKEAPFYCNDNLNTTSEWLGSGYYFWDTFIELAHWWGDRHYKKSKIRHYSDYVICQSEIRCDKKDILDLVGNLEQCREVMGVVSDMQKCPEFNSSEIHFQVVVHYIRHILQLPFKAIRCYSQDCCNEEEVRSHTYPFKGSRSAFVNLMPEVQICVIDKSILSLPVDIVYDSAEEDLDRFTF